ncbi:MAG: hypothetical protein HOP09_07115 [Hyphomicrobium sp.]|nr:hypothetical protein [Hyphomicrobium sp.]
MKRSITAAAGINPSEFDDGAGRQHNAATVKSGAPSGLSDAQHEGQNGGQSDDTSAMMDHLTIAIEKGGSSISRTIQQNPTLALAGLVAIGALAGLAIHNRRTRPQSLARQMQRDLLRHTRSVRHAVRQEMRDSGVPAKFEHLTSALGTIDWKPYLQPVLDKAAALTDEAKAKLSAASK